MATQGQPQMSSDEELNAIVNTVFCCSTSLYRALMSGLVGTLQKYGYTEAIRGQIAYSFAKACLMHENGTAYNHQDGVSSELGRLVYLGSYVVTWRFGGNTPANMAVCRNVYEEFRGMQLGSIEGTLRGSATEHQPTGGINQRQAFQNAYYMVSQYPLGGVGPGSAVPGLWTFTYANCSHP